MRAALLLLALAAGILFAYPQTVTAAIWTPFGPEPPQLLTQVQSLLRDLLTRIEDVVGRPVRTFRTPDRLQLGARLFYQPPTISPGATRPPRQGTPPSPPPGDCQGEECHDRAGFEPDTLAEQDFGHSHTPTPEP